MSFIHKIETRYPNRFAYGSMEYPFTLASVAPDITTSFKSFPGGIFHQDTFTPNHNLSTFYLKSLLPLLENVNLATGGISVFFHLSNHSSVADTTAKFTLDAQLLALLSHRASIGKLVAESKYAADPTKFTPLIEAQDAEAIRALVTVKTQEQTVLSNAADASTVLAAAWGTAQLAPSMPSTYFVERVQAAVSQLYRELIEITTEVEVQYLLERLN
ncbi:hypothetical protein C0991_006870 [Blastosporella zonata]|nr:hypothetical protein C0991_006870 [Blastosporella zonata]